MSKAPDQNGPMPLPTEEEKLRGPRKSGDSHDFWNYGDNLNIHDYFLAKAILEARGDGWDETRIKETMAELRLKEIIYRGKAS